MTSILPADDPGDAAAARGRQRPVLVVGAGPVGLACAAELARRGVPACCVDAADAPSALSKALLVWPRTLDVLRELGCGPEIARRSQPVESFRYYSSARLVGRIGFTERTRPVVLPQPDVEDMLGAALSRAGGQVLRGTRLTGLRQDAQGVIASLRTAGGQQEARFSYAVGCDGAGSAVREELGLDFTGATYPSMFMLADARVSGPVQPDAVHYYCSPQGVLVLIGLPSGRFRVFTLVPPGTDPAAVTLETFQQMADLRGPGGLDITDPSWIATFAVHARQASHYRAGRVFLAGDAAHIHSPAGGQGLNTGITDAHNLAWKLALAWHGRAGAGLLGTYHAERVQVAHAVLRQADAQTRAWLIRKGYQVAARDLAMRAATALGLLNWQYVPWLAGLRTAYRPAAGRARSVRAGGQAARAGALAPAAVRRGLAEQAGNPQAGGPHPGGAAWFTIVLDATRPGRAAGSAAGLTELAGDYPGLVSLAVLDAQRRLRPLALADRVPAGCPLILVRPDGHVAATGRLGRAGALRRYLASALERDPAPAAAGGAAGSPRRRLDHAR